MPASVDFARELFRPLAMDWLRKVPLDSINPAPIVKSLVDSGKVTKSVPQVLEPGSVHVSERGLLLWDTRSYDFSIDKIQQGMRRTAYCKYSNGRLAPLIIIRIVDIQHGGMKYELTMFQENPVQLTGNHVRAASRKYLEALGKHFSMPALEVAERLKEHIMSGSSAKRMASNQHSNEEGCLDHQIPIATLCLEQVRLDRLDPVSVVEAALKDNTIIEDTSNITPTPGAIYTYRKDKRLHDQLKWLYKKNRSHNGRIYEMYHGVTRGCLNQMIKVTCPPVHDYKVLWYLEDNEPHDFRTYCQYFKNALEMLCGGRDGALRMIEDEIQELQEAVLQASNQGPSKTSLDFILNHETLQ